LPGTLGLDKGPVRVTIEQRFCYSPFPDKIAMSQKITVLALVLFMLVPFAAQAQTDADKSDESAQAQPQEPAKIVITPHRAIYNMTLGTVKNGSNISDVSGKMFFEWNDVCNGWAVQQHLELKISYSEGDETEISSAVVTWESKDGKNYNFNVRRITNEKETENYRGKATMEDQAGKVAYSIPKDKTMELPPGTIFPSLHTEFIIKKALAGEKLFTSKVFDGSDEEGLADVSSFIGPLQHEFQSTEMNPSLRDSALLKNPGWNVRLAFFKIKSETGEPDYEMNMSLLTNGVAKSMHIDYGDFSVTGVLESLEELPSPGC